jgi:tRNA dimethylallyltransferase
MKAHGVPELTRYLAGEISLDEAARLAVVVTGQYAKRQFTWLRHQVQKDYILEEQYNGSSTPAILNNIRHFLLTLPD